MEVVYLQMPASAWDHIKKVLGEIYDIPEDEVYLLDDVKVQWRGVPE